jgi:bifunctional non-homologous end joining protein LigD
MASKRISGTRETTTIATRGFALSNMTPAAARKKLASLPNRPAAFIESMECLAVAKLPDGPQWIYEIKLDGYRAQAVKSDENLTLFSRRRKSFSRQFPHIVEALSDLPENTVVDGEVLALDESGHQISTCSRISARKHRAFTILSLICSSIITMTLPDCRSVSAASSCVHC